MSLNTDKTFWAILIEGDNVCLYHELDCLKSITVYGNDQMSFYKALDLCLKEFKRLWCHNQIFGDSDNGKCE